MGDEKRILVTFGRTDPLHLTEATYEVLGEDGVDYLWGPRFGRPKPGWAWELQEDELGYTLYDEMSTYYDVVYCGHGATLLEATAAGCEVMVLTTTWMEDETRRVAFAPAWKSMHLDHSGKPVYWWKDGVMEAMSRELRERRFLGPPEGGWVKV